MKLMLQFFCVTQRKSGKGSDEKEKPEKEPGRERGGRRKGGDDESGPKPSGRVSLFQFLEDKLPSLPGILSALSIYNLNMFSIVCYYL